MSWKITSGHFRGSFGVRPSGVRPSGAWSSGVRFPGVRFSTRPSGVRFPSARSSGVRFSCSFNKIEQHNECEYDK